MIRNCVSSIYGNHRDEIVAEVKKRLSLPNNVLIPDEFLTKHKDFILAQYNDQSKDFSLSRIARHQSLNEIGFGQNCSYLKTCVLGQGTYSTVFKGTSLLTNKVVALKEIELNRDEGTPFTAIREVSILRSLKHNNIITLHDFIYDKHKLTLVFEYVEYDLGNYIYKCDYKMNPSNVKIFLYQLLRGLKYCHDRKVLHRDIKPQNLLINTRGELKLADFGLARETSVPVKTFTDEVVTLWYRPPDVLMGNVDYGASIDMWGVGCIFFEMSEGNALFNGNDHRRQIENIFELCGTPDEESWPSFKDDIKSCDVWVKLPRRKSRDLKRLCSRLDNQGVDLLEKLIKCNPKTRISSRDAMEHNYLGNIHRKVKHLSDSESIFSVKSVKLSKETSGQMRFELTPSITV